MANYIFGNKRRITRLVDGICLPSLDLHSVLNISPEDVIYTNRLRSPLMFLLKIFLGNRAPIIMGVSDGLMTPLLKRSNGRFFLEDMPIDELIVMQPRTFELEKSIKLRNVLVDHKIRKIKEVDIDEVILLFPNNPTLSLKKSEFLSETRRIIEQASGKKILISAQSRRAQNFAKLLLREFPHVMVYAKLDSRYFATKNNLVIITGPSSTYLYDECAIPTALSFVRVEDLKYFYPLSLFQSFSSKTIWSVVSFRWHKLKVDDIDVIMETQKVPVRLRPLFEFDTVKAAIGDILYLLGVLK